MVWFVIVLVVVWTVVSKIRAMAGELQSGRGAERYRDIRSRVQTAARSDQPFSLQQVLAEIEKVKNQAQQQGGAGAVSRDQARTRIETSRGDRSPSPRAAEKWRALGRDPVQAKKMAGPMGRPSSRSLSIAAEVEEGQDQEHPAGFVSSATDAGAVERAVADQSAAESGSQAAPALRFTAAQLRNALVWREILGPPVSMREE